MYEEYKYIFERNKQDPDLFRFKYYFTKSVSPKTAPKIWKPWSKWVPLGQLQELLHRKYEKGFKFKLIDLKELPPGTKKQMYFNREKKEQQLYMWNKPEDIGRLRKNRKLAKLSSTVRIAFNSELNLDWKKVPISADDILGNFIAYYNRVPADLFYYKLNLLAPHLELTKEEKQKYLEAKQSNNLTELVNCLKTPAQLLINDRMMKAELLLEKKVPIVFDDYIAKITTKSKKKFNTYTVDLRERRCSCDDFKNISVFGFYCKHLYACNEKWKSQIASYYN